MIGRLLAHRLLLAVAVILGTAACAGNPVIDAVSDNHQVNTTASGVIKVEGLVSGLGGTCPTLTCVVDRTKVTTTAQTVFKNGWCSALRNGMKVQVEGLWQPDGSISAVEVKFDPK